MRLRREVNDEVRAGGRNGRPFVDTPRVACASPSLNRTSPIPPGLPNTFCALHLLPRNDRSLEKIYRKSMLSKVDRAAYLQR